METAKWNTWHPQHVALVIVFTVLISCLLFAALPWLTRVVNTEPGIDIPPPYIFPHQKQPKIPELERNRRIVDRELQPPPKPTLPESAKQNPKPDFSFLPGKEGLGEGVPVAILETKLVEVDPGKTIFDPSQLDKAPRIIRKVPPVYPFAASREGLRAWVLIRCLVDKDGLATRIVAAECDPADALDIFGPSAVDAVKKWRFSPGEIGGDPVPTRVAFRVIFEID